MRAAALARTEPREIARQLAEEFTAVQPRAFWVALDIVRDADEAADLVQEAFVRVQQALPRFRGDCSLRTYLLRVTVNLALKSERRRRVRVRLRHLLAPWTRPGDVEPDQGSTPEQLASGSEQARRLSQALLRLPAQQRAAFLLRHAHDLPLCEVAAVLQVAEGTVKTHLARAVKQLRRALIEESSS